VKNVKRQNLNKLPDSPGIYVFKDVSGKIMYIGKATSLRDRVRSYFRGDLLDSRGPIIAKMAEEVASVGFENTNSVLEALILEAKFIRQHLPPYNTKEKDNRSYNFVVVTHEKFPRVLIRRGRDIAVNGEDNHDQKFRSTFGPFPNGRSLKEALRIVRKIFPFRDNCQPLVESKKNWPCFNRQIGLCPGVCTGEISVAEYERAVRRIEMFFGGKTAALARSIEKDMKVAAKKREFEGAAKLRGTLFALNHIRDVTLISQDLVSPLLKVSAAENVRIEAYDIAHLGGHSAVGVMAVVENGEIRRAEGRRFKIRGKKGNDDIANLVEIVERRLNHVEWPMPQIIVVDGGEPQKKAVEGVLRKKNLSGVYIVSVVKDEKHRPREILGLGGERSAARNSAKFNPEHILLANNEAHRAAVSFHKIRRRKDFIDI